MTPAERTLARVLIDQARRARLDAQGGYNIVEREARAQDQDLGQPGHGVTLYGKGCRCDVCTVAHRFYKRDRQRLRRPVADRPAVGFLRQVA